MMTRWVEECDEEDLQSCEHRTRVHLTVRVIQDLPHWRERLGWCESVRCYHVRQLVREDHRQLVVLLSDLRMQ